ncbi:MAG: RNA-guided endonuclease InsQ/TnpB family protein [Nitrosopumilaceae archaeon]
MPVTRNYKFRLYPTVEQEKKLQNNLAICRWVYNRFVEMTKNGFVTRNNMNYFLTELKQTEPWLYNYHSKMLQMIATQLEGAQKALVELNKKGYNTGHLKFVGYNGYRTFTYNQSGYKLGQHGDTDLLWLSKIGYVEIRKHRETVGNIKQVSVSKSKSGKWYAIITCDIANTIQNIPRIHLEKSVGIDVGIKNFVYDSAGHVTPNPLNLKKLLKPLARIQRKISRRKKGSNNRKKAVRLYQRIHERITNRRRDFHHKLSTQYARNNDVVFVERLAKLNMVKNHKLARNIIDSGWGTFCNMLDHKCKMMIEVSARNTTTDCSRCGNAVPKSLAVRIHCCDKCDLVLDRDYNASLNILQKGLRVFGIKYDLPQELRKVTPVEISMRSMKQEEAHTLVMGSSLIKSSQ